MNGFVFRHVSNSKRHFVRGISGPCFYYHFFRSHFANSKRWWYAHCFLVCVVVGEPRFLKNIQHIQLTLGQNILRQLLLTIFLCPESQATFNRTVWTSPGYDSPLFLGLHKLPNKQIPLRVNTLWIQVRDVIARVGHEWEIHWEVHFC